MKKKLAVLFLLVGLLLTACAKPGPDIPTFVLDTSNVSNLDTANTFLMNYNFEHMTQSEQVIYKLSSNTFSILFYDKSSGTSGPLCGKPDCSHTGEDCNAYVCAGKSIQYYNGAIYIVAEDKSTFPMETWLWKCDLSGGNRKKIKKLDKKNMVYVYQPQQYILHRDTLYMLCETEAVIDGNAFNRIALLSTPLDSSEEFTVLWEDYVPPERHPAIRFMGQYIYIEAGVNSSKVDIYRFDTATGTVETLLSDDNSDLCYGEIGIDENGTLYLSSADEGTTGYVWKIANGQKEEIMTLPVNSYSPPDILDGYVASVCSGADRYKELTVKSLIGEQIYSGPLFTETIPDIPGDPNACSYGCVGNQGTVINYSLSYDTEKLGKEFIVSFDAAQTMKPVLVWHSEDVKYG